MEGEVGIDPAVEELKSKVAQAQNAQQASERKVEEMRGVIASKESEIAQLRKSRDHFKNECNLRIEKSKVKDLLDQGHRDLMSANASLKADATALRVKLKDAETRIQELECKVATVSQSGGRSVERERSVASTFAILEKNAKNAEKAMSDAEARSVELNSQMLTLQRKVLELERALKKAPDVKKPVEAEKENS